jgi:hypothetical protein
MSLSYEVRFLWGWNMSDCAHDMSVCEADTFKEYGLDCIYEPFQGDWMFVGYELPDSRFNISDNDPHIFTYYPPTDNRVYRTFERKEKLCRENPELRKYFNLKRPSLYILPYICEQND